MRKYSYTFKKREVSVKRATLGFVKKQHVPQHLKEPVFV